MRIPWHTVLSTPDPPVAANTAAGGAPICLLWCAEDTLVVPLPRPSLRYGEKYTGTLGRWACRTFKSAKMVAVNGVLNHPVCFFSLDFEAKHVLHFADEEKAIRKK